MTQSHRELEEYVKEATRQLVDYVCEGGRLAVVKAPPGSGKTYLLLTAAKAAFKKGQRVAIATQTRSQADDICRRFAADFGVKPIRFAAAGTTADAGLPYLIISDKKELPTGRCIVVGTSAKWGMLGDLAEFDVMFVEEAWQLAWADFMHLGRFAGRFVLIGDPGQIPPVVTIETGRWETAPRPPHRAAPELILAEKKRWRDLLSLDLPATRRLPRDTVGYIESFYDFEFRAFARDGERGVRSSGRAKDGIDAAIDLLDSGSVVAVTLPTPPEGPPLEEDLEIADLAVSVARRLLARNSMKRIDGKETALDVSEIGLCATHRVMNSAMALRLDKKMSAVSVDTPERWQGLERPVMVMVHPLSGVTEPTDFDLETGRLCVMASRHKAGLIVVTRDHLGSTLDTHLPAAEQPVGRPDVAGRGHQQNSEFWSRLVRQNRIAEM